MSKCCACRSGKHIYCIGDGYYCSCNCEAEMKCPIQTYQADKQHTENGETE